MVRYRKNIEMSIILCVSDGMLSNTIIFFSQNIGHFIDFETGMVKTERYDYTNDRKIKVFDKKQQCWRKMNVSEIPWTFTYERRPNIFREEARLWLRAAHRVKHRYIWARHQIPQSQFACLMSTKNIENYDRYVFINLQTQLVHSLNFT